jgi:hypothetical protein
MRTIEIIEELDKTHGLKILVNKSLLSWSILFHREIYLEFDAFRKMGYNVNTSVQMTSDKLNISERTVLKIKKKMES